MFTKLSSISFTPAACYEDLFTESLRTLNTSPALQRLSVNATCMGGDRDALLSQITGLESLTLHDPTRATLQLLPDWLRRLSTTLKNLHLEVSFRILS